MTDQPNFRALCAELIQLDTEQPSEYVEWKRRWDAATARARAALARYGSTAPRPIPVTERLPGVEDCDATGQCWCFSSTGQLWRLMPSKWLVDVGYRNVFTHWRPAHALPLLEVEE